MNNVLNIDVLIGTQDDEMLDIPSDFPDAVIMISLGGNMYAGVNSATTGPDTMAGPDTMEVNLLAVFANDKEAEIWENQWQLTGKRVTKEFHEARDIAISKPNVHGLGLQVNGNTSVIHWVR